jgi:DNA-binding transcriptional LysR family regulator
LAEEIFLPVCAPEVAAPHSLDPDELQTFRLIRSVKAQVQWSDWIAKAGVARCNGGRMLHFDRSHMAIDAAAAGLGVALESTLMMEHELSSGRLIVPVASTPRIMVSTQWLVCPPPHLRRRRVRLFLEWIQAEAETWQHGQSELIAQLV